MVLVVTMRTPSYINYYILCLVCWILLGITGVSTRSHALVKRYTGIYTGPFFDTTNPKNFTAQLGTHAFLPCRVRQLGNKSVSWVRKKDGHILSVDRIMFIEDQRFQAMLSEGSDTWTLQVKYVQARDEGDYECQISTDPKMSHLVHLNVVVPKVEIVGDRDRFVRTGSTVSLRCVINQSLEAPSYVFWYRKGERVLSDPFGKIEIHPSTKTETGFDSKLVIDNAKPEDSGNYTCSPSNLNSDSVTLHVLNGEHPAAIQRGISAAPGGCRALWWLAGSVSLSSNHGRRIFVLVVLISMALFTYQRSLRLAYIGATSSIVP